MKEDANRVNFSKKFITPSPAACPSCGRPTRHTLTIQSGRESVNIYRCTACEKEFVGEELRKKSD